MQAMFFEHCLGADPARCVALGEDACDEDVIEDVIEWVHALVEQRHRRLRLRAPSQQNADGDRESATPSAAWVTGSTGGGGGEGASTVGGVVG